MNWRFWERHRTRLARGQTRGDRSSSPVRSSETRRAKRLRLSRGMSLLETMIALGLFTNGMVAAVTLTNEISYTNTLSNEIANATTLARNLFEDFRVRDPEDLTTLGIAKKGTSGRVNGAGEPSPTGRFVLNWEFAKDTPHEGLQKLTIQVHWTDARGRERAEYFYSGLREGWPVPIIIPDEAGNHEHGKGHAKK